MGVTYKLKPSPSAWPESRNICTSPRDTSYVPDSILDFPCGSVLNSQQRLKFAQYHGNWTVEDLLRHDYRGLMMELLSPMAVMLEKGLGFNLCVAPFLNVCVLNLSQRVRGRRCQRWLELGWRCCTRVRWKETKVRS